MSKKRVVFKYGGNAMTNETLKKSLLSEICALTRDHTDVVLVHGGGPFIKEALTDAKIESEFIAGQRKTSVEALEHVEKALKGKVNGQLVRVINSLGYRAVGLSGKDGRIAVAAKRFHRKIDGDSITEIDLGQVGNIRSVDPTLLDLLLTHKYIPVMTCIASDERGNDYNINGDTFAGHIAGALKADEFIILTDVDGLLEDIDDPSSIITNITVSEIDALLKNGAIKGGMIPKLQACINALDQGAGKARIMNGTTPGKLDMESGTVIINDKQ